LLIFFPHFGSILQHVGTPRNGHARRKVLGYMKFFLSTYLQVYILHNPFNLYLLELPIRANLSFVCSKCFLYTFFSSFLAKQFVANPQPVPDCGPGATPPAFAGVTEPEVSAIRSRSLSQESPAAVALPPQPRSGLMPERGQRRRDWLRASPSARAENRLRASPAAQGKRQASPVGGVSPSFCCHSFHLIHPLFLAAPTFRLVELAGCGNGLLSCFLSGPGRLPHGLSAS
jgi:hypothetical protein